MSFTEGHALVCDCDECLNRGGGTPAPPARVRSVSPERLPYWRERLKERSPSERRSEQTDDLAGGKWTGW